MVGSAYFAFKSASLAFALAEDCEIEGAAMPNKSSTSSCGICSNSSISFQMTSLFSQLGSISIKFSFATQPVYLSITTRRHCNFFIFLLVFISGLFNSILRFGGTGGPAGGAPGSPGTGGAPGGTGGIPTPGGASGPPGGAGGGARLPGGAGGKLGAPGGGGIPGPPGGGGNPLPKPGGKGSPP